MHVKIELNNTAIEEVNSAVIDKLYLLAKRNVNGLDNSSNLVGRLHTTATYQEYIDFLTLKYLDLYINADKYYIVFEDTNMKDCLISNNLVPNDGIGISAAEASSISSFSEDWHFKNTTDLLKFNELRYFINIKKAPNFSNSKVLEIDLRNIEEIPSNSFLACYDLTSVGNTLNLKKVHAAGFMACTSLTSINLSNVTHLAYRAFLKCYALGPTIDLSSLLTFENELFSDCSSIETVILSPDIYKLNYIMFSGCTSLETINLSNITYFSDKCLHGCASLDVIENGIDFSNITYMHELAIYHTKNVEEFDVEMPSYSDPLMKHWFDETYIRSISNIGSITNTLVSTFKNCPKLLVIDLSLSTTLKTVERFFINSGCTALRKIVFPSSLESFNSANTWDKVIYTSNESLNLTLVCYATTPPTSEGVPLTNIPSKITVYVPDSSVSAYQASSFWNVCTIRGISELPS